MQTSDRERAGLDPPAAVRSGYRPSGLDIQAVLLKWVGDREGWALHLEVMLDDVGVNLSQSLAGKTRGLIRVHRGADREDRLEGVGPPKRPAGS